MSTWQSEPTHFINPDQIDDKLTLCNHPKQLSKSVKRNTGGVSFCWIGIQNTTLYGQKYTPPHCFFSNFARWVRSKYLIDKKVTKLLLTKKSQKVKKSNRRQKSTQLAHYVRITATLLRRLVSALTSFQRSYNIVLTSCASWESIACEIWLISFAVFFAFFQYIYCTKHFGLFTITLDILFIKKLTARSIVNVMNQSFRLTCSNIQ